MKLLTILFLLAGTIAAQAGLKTRISASIENTAQGRELVFRGTLSNTSPTAKLYLNDIAEAASDGNLAFRSTSFFSNVPGLLLPGESYADSELFRFVLTEPSPKGEFDAVVAFKGGTTIFANDDLGLVSCRVLVPAVNPGANNTIVYTFSHGSSLDSRLGIVAGELGLTFVPDSGLKYFPEVSTDLASWTPAESITEPGSSPPGLLSYRFAIPVQLDRTFIRLRLGQN